MRIAVCDDSRSEQEQLISAIRDWEPARKPERFTSGKELLEAAKKQPIFDIVFLDIYLPGENGVEIAETLRSCSPETSIVFVTNSVEYAVDAFSLNALHYLVKPVTAADVAEVFRRLARLQEPNRRVIALSAGKENYQLYLDEISYIQSINHEKELYLTNHQVITLRMSFAELKNMLDERFLKLSRSTLVNMEQIRQMDTDSCVMRDGTRLSFTRRDRMAIRETYYAYIFSRFEEKKLRR